jgi:precorrin-3B synthase
MRAGVIEATNRANLQIRGIGAEQQALIAMLLAAGLGPSTAAGDDVRNLMLSPSAGIDPQMLFDTRPLADQILATLQNHTRFHELSAKFAVQLDGGEALAMLEHHHDLWLSAFEQGGETLLAFGLAGCPGLDAPLAAVRLEQGHALVVAVLERFLDLATPAQTRMRHLPVDNFLVGAGPAVIAGRWLQAPGQRGVAAPGKLSTASARSGLRDRRDAAGSTRRLHAQGRSATRR